MPIGNLMCYVHFAAVCSVKCAASNIGGGHRTCVEYLITSPVGISYTLKIPDRRNITKSPCCTEYSITEALGRFFSYFRGYLGILEMHT